MIRRIRAAIRRTTEFRPLPLPERGRLYHRYPDGREELVSEKEMLEVAGFVYP